MRFPMMPKHLTDAVSSCRKVAFAASLLWVCSWAMMAIHELGHVLCGLATGGQIEQVSLVPGQISRTSLSVNPRPGFVAWGGPFLGCLLPAGILTLLPESRITLKTCLRFFTGLCLVANGAYIGLGAVQGIGDCRMIKAAGYPVWTMWTFGLMTVPLGVFLWHSMGSLRQFFVDRSQPTAPAESTVHVSSLALIGWLVLV